MSIATETLTSLQAVLAQFGLDDTEIHDIRGGRVNKHWRVVAAGGAQYALRRYSVQRSIESIAYEHAVLAHAGARGWPVAEPIPDAAGALAIEHEGALFALFPFLAGAASPYASARYLHIKGAMLARLHRDLASAPVAGQRTGFARVWEVDRGDATYQDLLREFAREDPDASSVLRRYRYSSLRELSRLGYGELDDVVVHWDFHHDNLLFRGGQLSGLLDFDSVHRDARVADIAQSVLLDCLDPPAHNAIRIESLRSLLAGYHEASRLTQTEAQLVVPLLFALIIARSAESLRAWLRGGDRRALASLQRAVWFRLPVMQAQKAALQAAVSDAVR
jgi:Ser/Thr protein kinase RdoA (MazF antagonist)